MVTRWMLKAAHPTHENTEGNMVTSYFLTFSFLLITIYIPNLLEEEQQSKEGEERETNEDKEEETELE
ncbi:hypothetical protein EYF80_007944 [Liparis tanakae]|uniref:Uncharacterized protein n=1 Tax=Liparis tanakae TaxID=230148 RepID=A0A4Z2IV48_9TELE|nr:hypothetical protein EYF80_007944 [Liparis tanakae]